MSYSYINANFKEKKRNNFQSFFLQARWFFSKKRLPFGDRWQPPKRPEIRGTSTWPPHFRFLRSFFSQIKGPSFVLVWPQKVWIFLFWNLSTQTCVQFKLTERNEEESTFWEMFDLLNLVRGRWSGARDPEVPLAGIAADGPSKRRSPCLRLKPKQKFEIPMFYYLTEEQRLAIVVVVRPREFRPLFFRVRWSANRPTAFKSPGDYACRTITYVTYLRVEKRFLEKGTSFLSIDLNRMRIWVWILMNCFNWRIFLEFPKQWRGNWVFDKTR